MNKLVTSFFVVGLSVSALVGCTRTEVGTVTGAAAGAGIGYAVSGGDALGTVIGAGAGAVIGNSLARDPYYYGYGGYAGYGYGYYGSPYYY